MTTLLSRRDIRHLATWPLLIEAVRLALAARQAGEGAAVAAQLALPDALLHLKAGALATPPILSVKANLRVTGKAAAGVVVLYDTQAGAVTGILDSADITAMRTASLAVVACQALAPAGAFDLAVVGAGPVAAAVIDAMTRSFAIGRIALWSRDATRAEALARASPRAIEICATAGQAAARARVVVTATPSRAPLLEAADLRPGALILALGADSPGKRELSDSIMAQADIIADQREDALRVGECAYLPEDRREIAELGDILEGVWCGKEETKPFQIFDSVGSALLDAAVCRAIMAQAFAQGRGTKFNFLE
jgi:ornithine cyclodeaminase/alanine dehydrogenase-like protein (mu-crystallin family)